MGTIPWILVSVLILVIILAVVAIYAKKKYKRPMDYYNLFIIGLVWFVIGIPLGNSVLWMLGLVFMIVGLSHKKEWKKNRRKWKDLKKGERKLVLGITIILSLLLIAGVAVLLLIK
ncbi:hypothetical protein ACFLZ7_04105 [Nanoarchaeota archaeon]